MKEQQSLPTRKTTQLKPQNKNKTILLVVDTLDGRGDLEHFKAFYKQIKQDYPELKIAALIGGWGANASFCHALIDFLKQESRNLDAVHINIETATDSQLASGGLTFKKRTEDYKHLVLSQLVLPFSFDEFKKKVTAENLAMIVQISVQKIKFTAPIINWISALQRTIPNVVIAEYGASLSKGHNMGLGKDDIGVRMIADWQEASLATQALKLEAITNVRFHKHLLGEPQSSGAAYLETRKLFAGYLQSEIAYSLFITTQVYAYICANKEQEPSLLGLDFYMPEHYLNYSVLVNLLNKLGIPAEEIVLVTQNTTIDLNKKIRLFTNKEFPLNDCDFKSLCYAATSVACAGDDSWTTAFSAPNLPFYLPNRNHSIKSNFNRDLYNKLSQFAVLPQYMDQLELRSYFFSSSGVTIIHDSYEIDAYSLNIFLLQGDTYNAEGKPYHGSLPNDPDTLSQIRQGLTLAYAKKIGTFIADNHADLLNEQHSFRKHLFAHDNALSKLPEILADLAFLKYNAATAKGYPSIRYSIFTHKAHDVRDGCEPPEGCYLDFKNQKTLIIP